MGRDSSTSDGWLPDCDSNSDSHQINRALSSGLTTCIISSSATALLLSSLTPVIH